MKNNSGDFSMQEAIRLAKSNAGQQLFETLKAQDSQAVNQAMSDAANGDYDKIKERLSAMLASPEIRTLIEQLRGGVDG